MRNLKLRMTTTLLNIEACDDHRVYTRELSALQSERLVAERLVSALITATGGPYRMRKPGRAEYETRQSLMYYAERFTEGWNGFRAKCVQLRLAKLGFDMALVEDAARHLRSEP